MESNRDEAEKCVEIADLALKALKLDRATTFLNKAERMYPSQRAKDLMAQVRESERQQHVNRILRSKNHYEALDIPKHATEQDIEAAFKKLAKFVHSDKHLAPMMKKADAAFRKLDEARKVLTDSATRSTYNLNWNDEAGQHQSKMNGGASEHQSNVNDGAGQHQSNVNGGAGQHQSNVNDGAGQHQSNVNDEASNGANVNPPEVRIDADEVPTNTQCDCISTRKKRCKIKCSSDRLCNAVIWVFFAFVIVFNLCLLAYLY